MRLFGDILPFIGWREYDEHMVDMFVQLGGVLQDGRPIRRDHRYSGFQIEWLFFHLGFGVRELGPREYKEQA